MIKKIRQWYLEYELNRQIKFNKSKILVISRALDFDKELKIYTPVLERIAQDLNTLFYDIPEKSDVRQRFVEVTTLRLRDHFSSIILLVKYQQYQSALSILRAICELLFLLKYVQKEPGYIEKFMEKTGRGKEIRDLRNAVNDTVLNEMYKELSNFLHPNPIGIKYCYYKHPSSKHILITEIPFDWKKFEKVIFTPFIFLMQDSTSILKEIKRKKA